MATLKNLRHNRCIVPLTGIRALIRGPGYKRLVYFTTQFAVIAVSHYREETGEIECNHVTIKFLLAGRLFGTLNGRFRDARKLNYINYMPVPVLSCIQYVVAITIR